MLQIAFQAAAAIIALTAAIMAWRLERRLIRLRTGQDGMQKAAAALTEAVTRAEASVRGLRAEGAETAQELETLIARARATSDELRLMQAAAARRAHAATAPAAAPATPTRSQPQWADEAVEPVRSPVAALRAVESGLMDRLRRVR